MQTKLSRWPSFLSLPFINSWGWASPPLPQKRKSSWMTPPPPEFSNLLLLPLTFTVPWHFSVIASITLELNYFWMSIISTNPLSFLKERPASYLPLFSWNLVEWLQSRPSVFAELIANADDKLNDAQVWGAQIGSHLLYHKTETT